MQRANSSYSVIGSHRQRTLQKYKMKTILCILSAVACCLVTFSLSTASPISDLSTIESTTFPIPRPAVGEINGSKLVITQVVKTVEFVVGLEEDDGDNSTEFAVASTPVIDTEIDVLNPALLKEVVQAQEALSSTEKEELSSEASPSIDGTKNEQYLEN